jgi:hypothetical protein
MSGYLRTWGRINGVWTIVQTDANGKNDAVYVTALAQVLKLNLLESPIYSNYGIPAQQSVMTQIFPDYYVHQTQRQFSQYFASLIITKINNPSPQYSVNITLNSGALINMVVPL